MTDPPLMVMSSSQLPSAPCNVEPSTSAGRQDRALTIDGMIWGDRSKEDFNMLAQLQKVRIPSIRIDCHARLMVLHFGGPFSSDTRQRLRWCQRRCRHVCEVAVPFCVGVRQVDPAWLLHFTL